MPDAYKVGAISTLEQLDPVFTDLVSLIFDDAVDPRELADIAKMSDGSEMHVPGTLQVKKCKRCKKAKCSCEVAKRKRTEKEKERLQARIGLASNVVGLAAGTTALAAAAKDDRFASGGKVARKIHAAGKKLPSVSPKTGKAGAIAAGGALGLQVGNTAGDLVANRVLARESKKDPLKKALADIVAARRDGVLDTDTAIRMADELVSKAGRHAQTRAQLISRAERAEGAVRASSHGAKAALATTAVAAGGTGYALGRKAGKKAAQRKLAPIGVKLPETGPAPTGKHRVNVEKAELVDYVYSGTISKRDDDKRLVFGWCNLSTVDGKPVVDLQGDYAPIEEIEKSAYAYVVKSRVGGNQHEREGEKALHVSDMVESFVATPDKLEQMGVPAEVAKGLPTGWWVGYHVTDDATWNQVKTGERAGFSIHGKGSRVQKSMEEAA